VAFFSEGPLSAPWEPECNPRGTLCGGSAFCFATRCKKLTFHDPSLGDALPVPEGRKVALEDRVPSFLNGGCAPCASRSHFAQRRCSCLRSAVGAGLVGSCLRSAVGADWSRRYMECWGDSDPPPFTPTKSRRSVAQISPDKSADQLAFPEGLGSHDDEVHRRGCRAPRCSRCMWIKHHKECKGPMLWESFFIIASFRNPQDSGRGSTTAMKTGLQGGSNFEVYVC
jgi:hypothetical protein